MRTLKQIGTILALLALSMAAPSFAQVQIGGGVVLIGGGLDNPVPQTAIQPVTGDVLGGLGNFATGDANFATGFGTYGCQPTAGDTCVYSRTTVNPPPGFAYSQEVQLTINTDPSGGFNGIQSTTQYSFSAGTEYQVPVWVKGDGTFTGQPTVILGDPTIPISYCMQTAEAPFPAAWTLFVFNCKPQTSGTSYISVSALTPVGATGTFWFGGLQFLTVGPLTPGSLVSAFGPYAVTNATTPQQTMTINSVPCVLQGSCAISTVSAVNGNAGLLQLNFSTGAGSCAFASNTTTCTITGSSSGGSVSTFVASAASWPSWLVPTVTNPTTTPTLAVANTGIPNSALTNNSVTIGSTTVALGATVTTIAGLTLTTPNLGTPSTIVLTHGTGLPLAGLLSQAANTVVGALTATTPSALAMPSCSGATNALIWTSGTGFGCNTITGGGGTTTNALTAAATGGAAAGTTFNGSAAITLDYHSFGAAPLASPTFTGTVTAPALTLSAVTGSAQCLHVNSSGVVSGFGADCGTGTTTNAVTFNNSNAGGVSGSTFNGSAALVVSYNTIGAAPLASPSFTGTVTAPNLTVSAITGATQCLQVNTSGVVSGTGSVCGSGGSGISGGTTGFLPLFGSATTITGSAHIDDGITTAGTITYTEPMVGPSISLTGPATGISGLGGQFYALGATAQVGTSPTAATCVSSVVCDSMWSTFSFATGTGSLTAGTIVTVTMPGTRTNIPSCWVNGNGFASGGTNIPGWFATASNSSGTVTVLIKTTLALAASTTYTVVLGCGGV